MSDVSYFCRKPHLSKNQLGQWKCELVVHMTASKCYGEVDLTCLGANQRDAFNRTAMRWKEKFKSPMPRFDRLWDANFAQWKGEEVPLTFSEAR